MKLFLSRLQLQVPTSRVKMTTCWVNRMGKGCYHTLHNHPMSLISGVYYLNAPKGASPLKIEDPRLPLFMALPARKASAKSTEQPYLRIPPVAGGLVMFESWTRHEVPPHNDQQDRLSVSFNYEF